VVRLSVPVTAGLVVTTAVMIVDRNLATGVSDKTVTWMRYATTLVQTVLGLVAAAVALAALPSLSRHHEDDDAAAFATTLRRALTFVTLLIVPVTLGLVAVGETVVRLVFQHGETTPADADRIGLALLGYLPGTLAAGFAQVLLFGFYARRDTLTPFLITVVAAAAYVGAAFLLVEPYGMMGLVIANSVQWAVTAAGALVLGHRAFRSSHAMPWRVIVAATVAGGVVGCLAWLTDAVLGGSAPDASIITRLTSVAVALLIGVVVYPGLIALAARLGLVHVELPERATAILARLRRG
jgi:putative peptidoglycan lipid II flippase